MSDGEDLYISLPASPESIAVARRGVAERAAELGLERSAIADLRTMASEACTNVVRHAYDEGCRGRWKWSWLAATPRST
jgi:serine/threonine-protein kinase RsbW